MEEAVAVRIGINGFGRIGMLVARAAMEMGGVEVVAALDGFFRSANSGSEDRAFFEMEYLLAVGRLADCDLDD